MGMRRSHFPGILTWSVLLFFYVPILLLVVNSFNANRQGTVWMGFTLRWYAELFSAKGRPIWAALSNTLIVATLSTLISTFLGTCAAFALHKYKSRLQDFDMTILEAARDLGANRWVTTWKVLVPIILPGIFAGALLAFTLSIDDFVITFFVNGPGTTTLPIQIQGMIKRGTLTMINALSTLLLAITFLVILGYQIILKRSQRNAG